jgi:hypothetical protein
MKIKLLILSLLVILSIPTYSQIFLLNSFEYVHGTPSNLSPAHELAYSIVLEQNLFMGPSTEINYSIVGESTGYLWLIFWNLQYNFPDIGTMTPYTGISLGHMTMWAPEILTENGSGYTIQFGISHSFSQEISFFVQGRYFSWANESKSHGYITQMGLVWAIL